jgi:DNA-binding winged helix-turn-helix (wHTH) protein
VTPATFRFDRFSLDIGDRQLRNGGEAVELSSRYFDALVLLVSEQGRLVGKDRFMEEVWRGVPVTDEALTQCIRTLRRQLGDDAARPRFIETVPKHGYRFIADVEPGGAAPRRKPSFSRDLLFLGSAGTIGGGIAGILGGLFYGFAAASAAGSGEISVLIVMLIVAIALGLIGAAAVAFGLVAAARMTTLRSGWTIVGAAAGGLLIGAIVKLIGLDAFVILFGRSPGDITGAGEGLVLGAVIGLAVWLGGRSLRRSVGAALAFGAAAGVLIALAGGHLMGGSLADLSSHFPGSRLRLDGIAWLFGETAFARITQAATAALEAAIFTACVAGAMTLARKESEQP